MTAIGAAPARLGWTPLRRVAVITAAAFLWAVTRAGVGTDVVNAGGWPSFARFWRAVAHPQLGAEFLEITLDAAAITLAFAILGTALSLVIGAAGALLLSERLNGRGVRLWWIKAIMVVPRAVHEVLWALLLLQVFGFDPIVAVLAIGIPFGAVTAKVFAETIDDADPGPYRLLRAGGAPRLSALAYGILPTIRGDLASYAFYRLECAIRSAAVLGVVGVGGLGFQLDLSFESLRYEEIWTLIAALMVLSGGADLWSSTLRRSPTTGTVRASLLAVSLLVPLAWRWAGVDLAALWSERSRRLAGDLVDNLFPSRVGPGGWSELVDASVDTVAMSILAITIAGVGGLLVATRARRPASRVQTTGPLGRVIAFLARAVLLLFRAVPAPIWAFLFVLVLFPGAWPGAVGLGVYNLGVLGRLYAEALEEQRDRGADLLMISGASRTQAFFYATFPAAAPRIISLTLYRWEVIVRETIVVGVVGAGGLGQLLSEHLAARDFAAVSGAIGALVVISMLIDAISASLRRTLR